MVVVSIQLPAIPHKPTGPPSFWRFPHGLLQIAHPTLDFLLFVSYNEGEIFARGTDVRLTDVGGLTHDSVSRQQYGG